MQQMEKSPRAANMPADQKEKQAEISAKVTVYIVYLAGAIGSARVARVAGPGMMIAYNLLAGAGASFSQSFGIAAHTLVVGIVSTPIFLFVLLLRPKGTIDQ